MRLHIRPSPLLTALTALMLVAASPDAARPSAALAASRAVSGRAAGYSTSDAITATDTLDQVLTAPSGLTTAQLASQVRSGKPLVVRVRTTPHALVTLTIAFADGTAIVKMRRADAAGVALFAPSIAYQPQGGPEAATITVTAALPRAGLDDTASGSVTVLPHIVLTGRIKAPYALVLGRTLPLTIVSNQPNATVYVTLIYPDGQPEPGAGSGYTDATGLAPLSIATSPLHGVGALRVEAVLAFGGIQRRLTPVVVHLRRPPARARG